MRFLVSCLVSLIVWSIGVQAKAEQQSISVDGIARTYVLIGNQGARPRPLILALHGNWGSGAQFARYGQWEDIARKHDVVVALPDGLNRAWNDGRPVSQMKGRKPREGLDDVKFLSELVNHLVTVGIADKLHVFVTGVSNGGMMTLRMLCDRADLFAGGAAVIASMPVSLVSQCKPSRPMPLLIMNGTEDTLVPYGPSALFVGTEGTAAFWRTRNGCSEQAQRAWLPDRDTQDGSKVERISYACPNTASLVIYRIDGGGHQMPSLSNAFALETMLGRRNHDIEGAEEIWAFFSRMGR